MSRWRYLSRKVFTGDWLPRQFVGYPKHEMADGGGRLTGGEESDQLQKEVLLFGQAQGLHLLYQPVDGLPDIVHRRPRSGIVYSTLCRRRNPTGHHPCTYSSWRPRSAGLSEELVPP